MPSWLSRELVADILQWVIPALIPYLLMLIRRMGKSLRSVLDLVEVTIEHCERLKTIEDHLGITPEIRTIIKRKEMA